MATNQQTNSAPGKKKPDAKEAPERRDRVDEAVWESFPSSDPGGSWAGRDIPPDEREKR